MLWNQVRNPLLLVLVFAAVASARHVVGFLADGVNDAPAMHDADTSLSADTAVDVAREAADFVLLEASLDVIRRGIEEGRTTFANTLKYILTTMSANLGNMISMAAASLFLPFLPLLAGQILLNNFLSDVPAVGIANDAVDRELIERPERWDMRFIARYMVEFGVLSSLFDFMTFAVLLLVFRAAPEEFRTGWFIESLLTELVIALVVRTRRPFFRSRPGTFLLWSTVVLVSGHHRDSLCARRCRSRICAVASWIGWSGRGDHGGICRGRRDHQGVVLPNALRDHSYTRLNDLFQR